MRIKLKKRKSKKSKLIKLIIILFIIVLFIVFMFKLLYNNIKDEYIDIIVKDSFGNYELDDIGKLSSVFGLLNYSFGIKDIDNNTQEDEDIVLSDPSPLVYIYNSHQTEAYASILLEEFSINYTVNTAAHILGEYLEDYGISILVEDESITDILYTNGWSYASSYKASRVLLENAVLNYPSLNFFIDLHRDSSSYSTTTTVIDGVSYARVMFVVGLKHDNYQDNLSLANTLNEMILEVDESLSRGVLEKSGTGANGIYNQDFSKNTILIEVGGQYNSIDEVNNTLKILAQVLYDYLGVGK